MSVTIRPYSHGADYERISRFLVDAYEPADVLTNWLQPRWEYMHHHPSIKGQPLERFGVAEDDGTIVGIVHFEESPTFAYFQILPEYDHAKPLLFAHALANLGGYSFTFERNILGLYVDDFDTTLQRLATENGFEKVPRFAEDHSRYLLDRPLPPVELPPGFRLQSLADENDLEKIHRVLWRGFDHEGAPPESGIAERDEAQQTPGFRKDLTIVAVAPDGTYASYAGIWLVPENRVAYMEPVATDPDFRRMGLGRAVVLESLRRAAALGATVAWDGPVLSFYTAIGFRQMFRTDLWVRDLNR